MMGRCMVQGECVARRAVPLALLLAFAAVGGAGCSTKAWYEGLRFGAQSDCRRQPPGETESCMSRVNTLTYEEYERSRLGQKPSTP